MKVNLEILNKTIHHFIIYQPHTSTQKIKGYFNVETTRELHALLNDQRAIKDTIAKLCLMANIDLDYFRMMYEVYRDGKVREDQFKIEFLKHAHNLAKQFRTNNS